MGAPWPQDPRLATVIRLTRELGIEPATVLDTLHEREAHGPVDTLGQLVAFFSAVTGLPAEGEVEPFEYPTPDAVRAEAIRRVTSALHEIGVDAPTSTEDTTPMNYLLPNRERARLWRALRDRLGLDLPPLELSRWKNGLLHVALAPVFLVSQLPLVAILAATMPVEPPPAWVRIPLGIVIFVVGMAWAAYVGSLVLGPIEAGLGRDRPPFETFAEFLGHYTARNKAAIEESMRRVGPPTTLGELVRRATADAYGVARESADDSFPLDSIATGGPPASGSM